MTNISACLLGGALALGVFGGPGMPHAECHASHLLVLRGVEELLVEPRIRCEYALHMDVDVMRLDVAVLEDKSYALKYLKCLFMCCNTAAQQTKDNMLISESKTHKPTCAATHKTGIHARSS